jgi:hypothetical protein
VHVRGGGGVGMAGVRSPYAEENRKKRMNPPSTHTHKTNQQTERRTSDSHGDMSDYRKHKDGKMSRARMPLRFFFLSFVWCS